LLKKGAIRDISLSDFDILTDGRIMLGASEGLQLENILLDNIHLRYAMIDNCLALSRKAEVNGGFFKGSPDLRAASSAIAAQNVKGLIVDKFRISWPVYPIPATWNLLKTDWRFLEPAWYKGNEDKVRSGEMKPAFKAFWGRNIREGKIDLSQASSSSGDPEKSDCENCNIRFIP